MDNNSYALVLTGAIAPGFAAETVWPALAAYFRMEPGKLQQQLVARAPLTIKQSDDLGKLQALQAGAAALGADTAICAPDGRAALFVLIDRIPRGPVPRGFVEERVARGGWDDAVAVAEVGSSAWRPFRELGATSSGAITVPPPSADPGVAIDDAGEADDAATRIGAATIPLAAGVDSPSAAAVAVAGAPMPAGPTLQAGFWRRCAAYVIDVILISLVVYAVEAVAGGIGLSASGFDGMIAASFGATLINLVLQWLYFAVQESSAAQATFGKRALGIKVTDDVGRRIGFGRASARFFGQILSSLILFIGYLMAGWTARKQALHDLIAGTLVVYAAVQPGQPAPATRPPMPWYGWLLNVLLVVGIVLGVLGMAMFGASLTGLATGMQGGGGF